MGKSKPTFVLFATSFPSFKMSQKKDEQIARAQELQRNIDQLTVKMDEIEGYNSAYQQERAKMESDLHGIQSQLSQNEAALTAKRQELAALDSEEEQLETQYMAMVKATPTLAQVMKK